jgi:hypothetical protein
MDDPRQRELFPRASVYRVADPVGSLHSTSPSAPEPVGVVLACFSCQHAYEPTSADWESANTGCPRCGGWTMTAAIPEPRGPS